jgi:hypothetical protein
VSIAILVAVIGLVGTVFASVPAYWHIRRSIGKTNGSGTVAAMLEDALIRLGRMEGKIDDHTRDRRAHRWY